MLSMSYISLAFWSAKKLYVVPSNEISLILTFGKSLDTLKKMDAKVYHQEF